MKILLTGSTGLLGGAVLNFLLAGGHEARCLVRPDSPNAARIEGRGVEVAEGDCASEEDLSRAMLGVEAVVHIAGVEYSPQVTAAMRYTGVPRLVAVSSTSAHSRFASRSGPKRAMEGVVRESGLAWTVVRPTMIFGSELDRNVHRLLRFLERSPVFPLFGGGRNLWQPVYFEDCAAGVYEALVRERAVCETYDLPGARPLAYRELVERAALAIGRRVRVFNIPLEPVRRTLAFAESLGVRLPVDSDQVLRLSEDKAYPCEAANRDLGYAPRAFEAGIELEVARLREIGVLRR